MNCKGVEFVQRQIDREPGKPRERNSETVDDMDRTTIPTDSSNSPDQTHPSRSCEKCASEMTHLTDLPSLLGATAVRIFRCYACNSVVSEDW
jgi:hypothetical protein